ncbi:endonuclease/exonuclease/phosphatase family protein [Mycolicibacterium arenosum]|uniref:Endonuclease/exonuclease/phosphatase family protein n=1 Tax=Mycolicibacterium arenosum TaxID=2952157 RepID=A0ABT1M7X0_9MYCO|nr:endonuclease/exonuclease/phosphatase family protein [Mycolicibacterium sp. CAU 1645]MCP9275276.1 endonuclease/exonuclease/phosphatase family protein [Mycolicibacterium sp. CAU 1645]
MAPQLPWYVRADGDAPGPAIRAITLNMLYGGADPRSVVAIASDNADVLMLQELTPEAVRGLTEAGIDRTFPFKAVDARPGASGAAVYSRYPLTGTDHVPGYQMAMVKAKLRSPNTLNDLTVVSMHFAAPWPQPIDTWHQDVGRFPQTLNELATEAGDAPILIGGDFNSTIDMMPYRALLNNGYRDAAEQSGAGRELTYPSNRKIPPLIGIDHFLTRNSTAVSTDTVDVAGTDHRALLTTVVLSTAD